MIKETANFSHSQTQQSQNDKGNRKLLPFLKTKQKTWYRKQQISHVLKNEEHDKWNSKFLTFSKTKKHGKETANFSYAQKQNNNMKRKQKISHILKIKSRNMVKETENFSQKTWFKQKMYHLRKKNRIKWNRKFLTFSKTKQKIGFSHTFIFK